MKYEIKRMENLIKKKLAMNSNICYIEKLPLQFYKLYIIVIDFADIMISLFFYIWYTY